ncbi:type II secretion system F family protein [Sulfolobus tengchongensis]|uniref:Type II secretion system F family protein n=1 Tax=Sulfolobus tengchongensis TaxID=207809 RepID=A0AAX4L659_9CREN
MIKLKQELVKKFGVFSLLGKRISENIAYYGDDIEKLHKEYKKLILLIPLFTFISIFLYIKVSYYFVLINTINIFIYFYPFIVTEIRKSEQRKNIENEIPMFLLFAYVNSLLGKSLYKTFEEIRSSTVFKGFKKEALLLTKEVEVLGKSSLSAMESRAKVHRSDFLGKIYSIYTSGEILGISMSERLKDLLTEAIENLNIIFQNYIERVNELVEILFMLFLVTPMILLAFQYISSSVNIFTLLMPLILAPMIFFYITAIQPNIGYEVKINVKEIKNSLFMLPIPLVLVFLLHLNLKYDLLIFYLLFVVFSFIVYRRISFGDNILNNLPSVLADIADYLRLGYSLKSALLKISSDNPNFKKFLDKVAVTIRSNRPLSTINTDIWIVNSILELIENIDKKGFADSFTFKDASLILNNYISLRNKVLKSLQLFSALAVITPFIFYFALGIMSKIRTIGGLDFISLIYSITLSIMYARISRFTIFNFPLLVIVFISIALVLTFGHFILAFI